MEQAKEKVENNQEKINPYKLAQSKMTNEDKVKRDILIDKTEETKVILGDSYLKNYLQTGRLKKSFAILTDKRIYMRGQCYEKKGLFGLRKSNINKVLDVQDITGTEYRSRNKPLVKLICLGLGIPALLFTSLLCAYSLDTGDRTPSLMFTITIGIIITLVTWFIIFFFKDKYEFLDISFAGGRIAYDCGKEKSFNIREFQRQMRLAKDEKVSKQETVVESKPINLVNTDKIGKLKELKELLDSGIITELEFNKLKSDILNNKE